MKNWEDFENVHKKFQSKIRVIWEIWKSMYILMFYAKIIIMHIIYMHEDKSNWIKTIKWWGSLLKTSSTIHSKTKPKRK